jgi:tetratricopeptide (TPR) repeat protein
MTLALVSRLPERRPAASLPSRLTALFNALAASAESDAATSIEDAIWDVWMHDDHDAAQRALERSCDDIAAHCFDMAETRLMALLRRRPRWAEAWNKAATLYYLQERDDESVAAIHRTLELEPRHFGALCGLAEILREGGECEAASLVLTQALRVHPHLASARALYGELRSGNTS